MIYFFVVLFNSVTLMRLRENLSKKFGNLIGFYSTPIVRVTLIPKDIDIASVPKKPV